MNPREFNDSTHMLPFYLKDCSRFQGKRVFEASQLSFKHDPNNLRLIKKSDSQRISRANVASIDFHTGTFSLPNIMTQRFPRLYAQRNNIGEIETLVETD